jgi:gluconolactonase
MFFVAVVLFQSCKSRPEWAGTNDKVIKEYNVVGRTRTDIPDTKVTSNLTGGIVDNIKNLPELNIAEGVTAKAYWGKGVLLSFVTLNPNASMPEKTIKGERFLFVLSGNIQELINGSYASLKAVQAGSPEASIMAKREFVYLQDGAKTAIKGGEAGARILEVYSPVPSEYLEMAGVKDIPDDISFTHLPVKPTVEPNKIYDLDEFQYAELVPGANSRIIAGYGAQISFLRMNPGISFAHHMHPEEQLMIGLRGWIDEIIMDKTVRMSEGDILYIPAGLVHGGNLGPYGCDAIDVFFPPRTDYESFRQARQTGYNAIIPEDASLNIVLDGSKTNPFLNFTEGPLWLNGKLYFSNMYFDSKGDKASLNSSLIELSPDGTYRNILQNKMQTNGIIANKNNNLIVCNMSGHRVLEMDTNGKILKVLADSYDGKSLDGPNDLVMDPKGGLYFTDPQYTAGPVKNQPGRSVYYLTPESKLIRLLEPNAFVFPNGLALSPDNKTLYINNSQDNEKDAAINSDKDNFVWAYDVQEDGTITNGRKFAELYLTAKVLDRESKSSGADGMKVDVLGNLYVCTSAGLQIFNKDGNFVGIINMPTYPVNCAFGGPDMQTLYITSFNKIYSIRTNVKGVLPSL